MAAGWREGVVAGSGLLVLASGFMPWWEVRVRVGEGYQTYLGSAWHISSRWSAAVVVAVAAVVSWLVWRLLRGRVPRTVWLLALAALALSMFLVLDQRNDIRSLSAERTHIVQSVELSGDLAPELDPAGSIAAAWMTRDRLWSYQSEGLTVGVGWGLWLGLAGIVLAGMSLAAAGSVSGRA